MKKLLGTLVLLLLLGLAAYFFVFQRGSSTFNTAEAAFAIENTQELDKIIISDIDGSVLNLERFQDSDTWTGNNRYVVRPDAVKVLLSNLNKIRIYAPVPKTALASVEESIRERSKKVELFAKDKMVKTIYMAGPVPGGKGDYMQLEGDNQPYITHVPGHTGFISRIFFTDIKEWRSREAINLTAKEIKSVQIEYINQPEYSFELQQTGGNLTLKSLVDASKEVKVNKIAAQTFLSSFENINIEAFHNDYTQKDSVLSYKPLVKMSITSQDDRVNAFEIYPMFINERSKSMFDKNGNPLKFDRDHYYTLMNEGRDFAIIQDYVFAKLFRRYDEFAM